LDESFRCVVRRYCRHVGATRGDSLADAGHGSEAVGAPARKGQGRVVRVEMTDNAYSIKDLTVKAGEAVRFVIAT
jgi:plastocyanin